MCGARRPQRRRRRETKSCTIVSVVRAEANAASIRDRDASGRGPDDRRARAPPGAARGRAAPAFGGWGAWEGLASGQRRRMRENPRERARGAVGPVLVSFSRRARLPSCRKMTSTGRARAGGAGGRPRTTPLGFRNGTAAALCIAGTKTLREGGPPVRLAPWASKGRRAPHPRIRTEGILAPVFVSRARDRSRRGAAQTGSPAPRRARRCVVDVHQGPLHARHRARSGRSARGGAESVASRRARSAGFSIPRERRTQNGVAPFEVARESRSTDRRAIRAVREPPRLGARAKPRPATRTCARPREVPPMPADGGVDSAVHFFVRGQKNRHPATAIFANERIPGPRGKSRYGQMVSTAALLTFSSKKGLSHHTSTRHSRFRTTLGARGAH